MIYKILSTLRSFFIILFASFLLFSSCGIYKKSDARKVSPNAEERVQKNMEEGRAFKLFGDKNNGGVFQFASANELWRASLEILDFAPLQNVDYAGGVIVTDWFTEGKANEQIKISIQFLSNDIRVDGLKVDLYKKICSANNSSCTIKKVNSRVNNEIKIAIIKKATLLKKTKNSKKKN